MFSLFVLLLSLNSQVCAVIVKGCFYDIGEGILLLVQQLIIEVLISFLWSLQYGLDRLKTLSFLHIQFLKQCILELFICQIHLVRSILFVFLT